MRLKKLLLVVTFLPLILQAQTTSISPYSGFGLGELAPQGYDLSFAMGGVGFGFDDSLSINPLNPASYSNFKANNPIFQLGYKGQILKLISDVNSETINNGTVNNISLGFRISKKFGVALGFNPATTVGYNIISGETITDADGKDLPIKYEFSGEGGFTKVFAGVSYNIFEKRDTLLGITSSLSAGINFSYFTGSKQSIYQVVFNEGSSNYYSTRYQESQIIGDFGFDLGLQYQNYLKKVSSTEYVKLSLGLTFNIPKNFKTKWESYYYTFGYDALNVIIPQDTIFYSDDLQGTSYIPLRVGGGFMIDINNQLQFGADYEQQNWEDYKELVGDVSVPNKQLTNNWRISVGGQYVIVPMRLTKLNTAYYQTITFRLGGRYSTDYLKFGDYQLVDKALSFGFKLPLSKSQSYSSINLGMEFGSKGTTENGLIKEDYFNWSLGVILLPHRFNKWFVKKKYN
jgi:hypothetical protein